MSRLGIMLVVVAMIFWMYGLYYYFNCINASDSANLAAEELAKAISRAYRGPIGTQILYYLPTKIENHPYNLTLSEKGGIVITVYGTKCGYSRGGAPLNMDVVEYLHPVKNHTENNVTLLITHETAGISIGRKDNCAGCIQAALHAAQENCPDPNEEYVTIKNNCSIKFDLSNWTISSTDLNYSFPEYILEPGAEADIRTGCGTDVGFRLYWCQETCIWSQKNYTLRDWQNNTCLKQ